MRIQSIQFPKSKYTYDQALTWLTAHNRVTDRFNDSACAWTFEQLDPLAGVAYTMHTIENHVCLLMMDSIYD